MAAGSTRLPSGDEPSDRLLNWGDADGGGHDLRSLRGLVHDGDVRPGAPTQVVHSGVRPRVSSLQRLRFPFRRVAVRCGRGRLVRDRPASLSRRGSQRTDRRRFGRRPATVRPPCPHGQGRVGVCSAEKGRRHGRGQARPGGRIPDRARFDGRGARAVGRPLGGANAAGRRELPDLGAVSSSARSSRRSRSSRARARR